MVKHDQLWLVSLVAILICMAAMAQVTSLQHQEVHCDSVLMDMSACASYIINGSQLAKPEAACCPGFKKVVKEHPNCICEAFKNEKSIPIPIDHSRALSLPSVCNATVNLPCSLFPPSGHSPAPSPSEYDYSPYPGNSLPPSPGDGSPPRSSPDRDGDQSPHPPSPKKSPPTHAPAPAPADKKAAPPTTASAPANSSSHIGHAAPAHGPVASGATALSQSSPVVFFLAAVALKLSIFEI